MTDQISPQSDTLSARQWDIMTGLRCSGLGVCVCACVELNY